MTTKGPRALSFGIAGQGDANSGKVLLDRGHVITNTFCDCTTVNRAGLKQLGGDGSVKTLSMALNHLRSVLQMIPPGAPDESLAVNQAQKRRVCCEGQLKETKEKIVKAEIYRRTMQTKTGVVPLDRQAEAVVTSAA